MDSSPDGCCRHGATSVELFLLGDTTNLCGDPALAAARYAGVVDPAEAFDPDRGDLVIDALYGAGLSREVDGLARRCVERINAYAARGGAVLAVDVPSGIDGGTGEIRGVAVRASASVTFFRLKPGHLLLPGRECAGRLLVADIGIGADALAAIAPRAFANAPSVWLADFPGSRPGRTNIPAARRWCFPARRIAPGRRGSRRARRCAPGLGS